ncbi:hypothetical protein JOQ06_024258, partial [Pogonophryne albipinna]
MACDVMTRLQLPLSQLRGQTYDGAANMTGRLQGVQAILRKEQPLAVYCHCGPHCVNLITQAACGASPLVRDAMGLVHELGGFFNQSGKFKLIFQNIAKSEHGSTFTSLKPLCPTRWTVRTPAIRSVLKQYESVLMALEEMASCSSPETSAKANAQPGLGSRDKYPPLKFHQNLISSIPDIACDRRRDGAMDECRPSSLSEERGGG